MACRTRPGQGLTGAFQGGHDGKQTTEALQEHHTYWRAGCAVQHAKTIATQQNGYWRPPPPPSPSAPPLRGPPLPSQWQGALEAMAVPSPLAPQWQGALEARAVPPPWQGALEAVRLAASQALSAGGLADRHQPGPVNINVQLMYVNELHVHVPADPTESDRPPVALDAALPTAAPPPASEHFHPNDPLFLSCCYFPQGLDFGLKVVSRAYKAKKYEDPQYNMVVYYQCSGAAEILSHTVTLNLSHKRTKHAIFLFDCSVDADELASKWSPFIHLSEIKSMIQELGPKYEYHRNKVKNERFSLYFYIIKRAGAQFAQRSQQIWSNLFRWAHAHQDSLNKSTAIEGSKVPQIISQVAGIGLGIIGAIA